VCSEHLEELKVYGTKNIGQRHEAQLVRWFESKMRGLHARGEVSSDLFALAQGPDPRPRTLNRCHINNWLFRTVNNEKTLVTQISGVLVKGEAKGTNWYGVIKRMISLEFPRQKEVILFQRDWFDVPLGTSTNRGKGYSNDKFRVMDIDTTRHKFWNEPYILATQAELVFYVNLVNKPGWSSVISMKPRNLFGMPELDLEDSLAVGIEGINLLGEDQDLKNWYRSDNEGTTGDVSVINQVQAEAVDELDDDIFDVDDEHDADDTYIDDGIVAPIVQDAQDDEFLIDT
jgi:hypothetical protein